VDAAEALRLAAKLEGRVPQTPIDRAKRELRQKLDLLGLRRGTSAEDWLLLHEARILTARIEEAEK